MKNRIDKLGGSQGFTLMELLVVVGIILLLGGIMFPAFSSARQFARKARAKTDVKQLDIALKGVLADYRSWTFARSKGNMPDLSNGKVVDKTMMEYLAWNNPKRVPYMEFDGGATNINGQFADPWKNGYHVATGDGEVSTPAGGKVYRDVIAWSFGPDGKEATGDDVKSWE
jgi:prepilin-type N-terminal cleavage/methylation domain-containing protein